MFDNPYQSPQSTELIDLKSVELDPQNRRGRGPLLTVPVGFLLGGITVAVAGAIGAAALGLFHAIGNHHREFDGLFFMGMIGGGFGLLWGAIWGAGTGLSVGLSPLRRRTRFIWTSSIMTGLYGASVGFLGGCAVSFGPTSTAWIAIGMAIGAVAGTCGGWLFIHMLSAFCWGHLRKESLPENGLGFTPGAGA